MPSTRKRILFIEINDDGTVGGSHRALFDLVRYLDAERYEPIVLFYQDNRYLEAFRAAGVRAEVWPRPPVRGRSAYAPLRLLGSAREAARTVLRCRRFLRRESIDLVHMNNAPIANFEDWLPAARWCGIPCISHARGGESMRPGPIGRLLVRRFDRVLAVSRYMAGAMAEAGVPAGLIETVHDGLDLEEFEARVKRSRKEVRRELGVPEDRVLAVMVGHLKAWKGQGLVLEALTRMAPRARDHLQVLFVGSAPPGEHAYRDALEATLQSAGLERCARLLGERDDVAELMHAADVVLHASTLPEPFGLVVVEGMSLGRPVLASRLGGPTEIFSGDESDGLTFDPRSPDDLAAQLARLVEDPALRASIGAAARIRARRFGVQATADRVEAVYASLLGAS